METPKETMLAAAANRTFDFVNKDEKLYPYISQPSVSTCDDRIFRNGTMGQGLGHFSFELPKPPEPLDVSDTDTSSTTLGTK